MPRPKLPEASRRIFSTLDILNAMGTDVVVYIAAVDGFEAADGPLILNAN